MTDLLYTTGEANTGGNYRIWFVPIVGIASMPTASGPLTFWTGYRLYECYGTEGTKNYAEEQEETDNGPVWNQTITAFLPGDSPSRRAELASLVRHHFVVEIEDNTGLRRRVGTRTEFLTLSYSFTTGGSVPDRRGAMLKFTGTTTKPAPILT